MLKAIVRQSVGDSGPPDDPPEGLSPLLWRIYRARGVTSRDEVETDLAGLIPPERLQGLDRAVRILADALRGRRRILIVGDFDADGATSCALAVRCLRAFGADWVDYLVPNRFEFGYGLTPEIVEVARSRRPEVIVTVDNGISSIDGLAAARRLGWQTVITDHHLAGEQLPEADAIVNPNAPGCSFPSKALAGVGVIFYVMLGLRAALREAGWFSSNALREPNMADYLDLVALGTVADVVPLDRNNRILVRHGLERMRSGHCRPGITALLRVAGRNPSRTQAGDLGFAVGPRLNAAGRLDDMSQGIECLLSEDESEALAYAQTLDRLNRERRSIEDDMKQQAEAMLGSWSPQDGEGLPWGLCLFRPEWHQGVIGILASRIKERLHRPVIAFASADDGLIKGSARSIEGLHIRDALAEVAVREPGILSRFGGHAMAAGMTLRESDFERFAACFDRVVREQLRADALEPIIHSDGSIAATEMTLDTARAISAGGPWGQGFEEPLFDDWFEVISSRVVGEKHWKLVLRLPSTQTAVDGIAFNAVSDMP
jgi:single-stranded-DNA-specific exonuclease